MLQFRIIICLIVYEYFGVKILIDLINELLKYCSSVGPVHLINGEVINYELFQRNDLSKSTDFVLVCVALIMKLKKMETIALKLNEQAVNSGM